MPIYEYVCTVCDDQVEVMQSHDAPAPVCEKDKIEMKKILSSTFFRFRGGGFYSIDYKPKKMGEDE